MISWIHTEKNGDIVCVNIQELFNKKSFSFFFLKKQNNPPTQEFFYK